MDRHKQIAQQIEDIIFEKLFKRDKYFEICDLPIQNQEEINSLNSPGSTKESK